MSDLSQDVVLALGQLLSNQNVVLNDLAVRVLDQTRAIEALQGRIDERDAELAALTNSLNSTIRQVRLTLQQAQRAASKSQELNVANIHTIPSPPKPRGR